MDRVHGDGDLPDVDVIATSHASAEDGYYHGNDGQLDPETGEITGTGYMIGIQPASNTPRLSTAHEVGHLLDHKGMGTGQGWSSELLSSGSESLGAWRQAVEQSRQTQRLRQMAREFESEGGPASLLEHTRGYLLLPREQFARSYAQWLALRAGNQDMVDELRFVQSFEEDDRHLMGQWDDADFQPIAQSIDDLMKELQWRA